MTSSCIAPHLCSQRQHHKSCTHIFGGIGWGFYSRASRVSNQLKEIMRVSNNRRCTHFLSLFSLVVCRGIELANAWSARPFPTGKSQLRSVQKEYQRRREFCNLPDTCRCMMLQDSDSEKADSEKVDIEPRNNDDVPPRSQYSLGIGKNMPLKQRSTDAKERDGKFDAAQNWIAPQPVRKPQQPAFHYEVRTANVPSTDGSRKNDRETYSVVKKRKMVARDQESQQLRSALWHEEHFRSEQPLQGCQPSSPTGTVPITTSIGVDAPRKFFEDIDMSIPSTVYNDTYDAVWELLRFEAYKEAQREPLLVSFLHSTILNHRSMESSLAFLLANQLSSPMMISTQLQSFILEALNSSPDFRRAVRADMLAVRDRDPACTCLPDVFLYFKGFQALQSHRVAHCMWNSGKTVLAHYLQSQVSQMFQIDIHPNATMGEGIMLDHGTGIVIGETALVGNNCSILHHVTLGGSGKKGVDRHPKVKDGVLLGAGATVLGNVVLGEGCQVGAGTLVISDLPAHSVAVGVPAKIIGSFIDVSEQPSSEMNQLIDGENMKIATFESSGI